MQKRRIMTNSNRTAKVVISNFPTPKRSGGSRGTTFLIFVAMATAIAGLAVWMCMTRSMNSDLSRQAFQRAERLLERSPEAFDEALRDYKTAADSASVSEVNRYTTKYNEVKAQKERHEAFVSSIRESIRKAND